MLRMVPLPRFAGEEPKRRPGSSPAKRGRGTARRAVEVAQTQECECSGDEEGGSQPFSDADFDEVFTAGNLAGDGSPLLLAVSGGPDSTALMRAAAAWSGARGSPPLFVATVDHGLRPEARAEAEMVGAAAQRLCLPHAILTWRDRPERVSQETARVARYALLVRHAVEIGATRLATAHTFDDQVETILMRLADGSGLSGLAGMAPVTRRGPISHLRPLLHRKKAALVATCRARGWDFAEDPTNRDTRFARPRWRTLGEALAREGLTPERIVRLGGRMRRADIALEMRADEVLAHVRRPVPAQGRAALDLSALAREPDEIVLRVLIRVLREVAPEQGHLRLERVEAAFAVLVAARLTGSAMRRSLGGCVLSLDREGLLTISPEAPRKRGR